LIDKTASIGRQASTPILLFFILVCETLNARSTHAGTALRDYLGSKKKDITPHSSQKRAVRRKQKQVRGVCVCVCVRAWGWSREGSRDMGTATRSQSGGVDQCRGTNSHRAKQLHQPSEEQEVLIYPTLASDGLGAWKGSSWPWSTSDHISLGWAHGRSYRIPQ